MAEGIDQNSSQEPSMEEILASIRKIIADDDPSKAAEESAAPADEVLELTQMVGDDGSVVDMAPPPPPEPVKEVKVEPPPVPVAPPPVIQEPLPVVSDPGIVSEPSVDAANSSLSQLAHVVEVERVASETMTSTLIGNSGRTLEEMVVTLMRPMLKEWLDKNLPTVVDHLVQKEIERIAKRGNL